MFTKTQCRFLLFSAHVGVFTVHHFLAGHTLAGWSMVSIERALARLRDPHDWTAHIVVAALVLVGEAVLTGAIIKRVPCAQSLNSAAHASLLSDSIMRLGRGVRLINADI